MVPTFSFHMVDVHKDLLVFSPSPGVCLHFSDQVPGCGWAGRRNQNVAFKVSALKTPQRGNA